MKRPESPVDIILNDLLERSKELNTLYHVEEIIGSGADLDLPQLFRRIIEVLPHGWQFPEICQARIIFMDEVYEPDGFSPSPICLQSPIRIEDKQIGTVEIYYARAVPNMDGDYFLKEEKKLIDTIADRIGETVFHRKLKEIAREWDQAKQRLQESDKREWRVILDLLEHTDQKLFILISRKMLYQLFWKGIGEAQEILAAFFEDQKNSDPSLTEDLNRPSQKQSLEKILASSREVFQIASRYLTDTEISTRIQKWIQEDKSNFLFKVLINSDAPLAETIDAITRYRYLKGGKDQQVIPVGKGVRVSLIRRFLSDHLDYINVAKEYLDIQDFYQLTDTVIYPSGSFGRLGGKSSGLFLAEKILRTEFAGTPLAADLRVPKTWYITADAIGSFITYNNMEEITEQKYKDLDQIRLEYPNIIQLFKNAIFPPDLIKGLSLALDDLGDTPLIVRSSSLLEDRMGTAFSGKYKSLFLANQGSKAERLGALMDAVSEVYASVFSPDPIEYRIERNLLDFHEEMGIMIQQVVGIRIGKYFFPPYAGVAFSNNEFRWSPRIKREDGLIRLVLGLGTRAVDRLADDYPVLISPGRPNLRANVTPEEIKRYAPKKIDLINLENNTFHSLEINALFREIGSQFPNLHHFVSIIEHDHIFQPTGFDIDVQNRDMVVSFEGLATRTGFIKQVGQILKTLQEKMGTPVDIEFASDGRHLYLLQCRPQSSNPENIASPIPRDIPPERIIFNARKYISNGRVPDITHIVYIDPEGYQNLTNANQMLDVGKAVSKLNKILPKRQFILIGPGRWGSRGDIKLGVSVTYSDFNNTAALIEVARKKGNYVPELSFGTHFFQDLVESSIRYLPLYPDDPQITFNEEFLLNSPNVFAQMVPEFADLAGVVRVIDLPTVTGSMRLRLLMNADIGEAVGFLVAPETRSTDPLTNPGRDTHASPGDDHWQWRVRMAEAIAARLDGKRFGVHALYLFGSSKNATAGPGSDIDLLIHFRGDNEQKQSLQDWLAGWSLCLAELNHFRTGYPSDGLLDIHYVTDEDIAKRTSYAVKIGAVTDAARPLPLGKSPSKPKSA